MKQQLTSVANRYEIHNCQVNTFSFKMACVDQEKLDAPLPPTTTTRSGEAAGAWNSNHEKLANVEALDYPEDQFFLNINLSQLPSHAWCAKGHSGSKQFDQGDLFFR
jgi:hypothetical protein